MHRADVLDIPRPAMGSGDRRSVPIPLRAQPSNTDWTYRPVPPSSRGTGSSIRRGECCELVLRQQRSPAGSIKCTTPGHLAAEVAGIQADAPDGFVDAPQVGDFQGFRAECRGCGISPCTGLSRRMAVWSNASSARLERTALTGAQRAA